MKYKSQKLEPVEWVSDNMIRTKCIGYSVGDQERIEFDGNEYEVVVVDKEKDTAIVEVLEVIQDKEIEILDDIGGGLNNLI